jgi:hypothetical protein
MQLSARPATVADFEAFFVGLQNTFGYGEQARSALEEEWRLLRNNPSTISLIVEDSSRVANERCVAYAQAVFVSDALVHAIKTDMPPCVNLHLVPMLRDPRHTVLKPGDVAAANSGAGLNVLFTHWGWYDTGMSEAETMQIREFLTRCFFGSYRGYKLKEIVLEVFGERALQMAVNAGFRLRSDYGQYFGDGAAPPADHRPYLTSVNAEEALSSEGSLISQVFVYSQPRFYFRPHEQELLFHALRGIPDHDIADSLCVTMPAIKKRWLSIYDRVSAVDSTVLPPTPDGSRGTEKRRVLIQYLQDHLEELRPIAGAPPQSKLRK